LPPYSLFGEIKSVLTVMATYPAPTVDSKPAIKVLEDMTGAGGGDLLLLSLGGSARTVDGIRRGENTVVALAEKVLGKNQYKNDTVEIVVVSAEPMETDVIGTALSKYVANNIYYDPFPVKYIQATIPSVEGHVLPPFLPDTALVERKKFLAEATLNSLAASGKETAEGSTLIRAFTDMVKSFSTICVHNDLWYEQRPYGCINIYLEQTPCILYALKQAVDNGSTVKFIKLDSKNDCTRALGFVPTSTDVTEWTSDTDPHLREVEKSRGGRSKKRRRVKTNVLPTRSRTRRSVSTARFLGR
jgi:hypothetical protein